MKLRIIPLALVTVMVMASAAGYVVRPKAKASDRGVTISLESTVPKQFGDWQELKSAGAQVVNPQIQKQLDELYSQILTRTYVNSKGYVVMLSLAYGEDQRGGLQAHRPEVCYPAQGFKLLDQFDRETGTEYGTIDSRRLRTSLGTRVEPITYWIVFGGQATLQRHEKRWAEFKLALTGQVPDGLLFRISSIDDDADRAFMMHDRFVNDLLKAASPTGRRRLAGLGAEGAAPGS